MANGKWDVELLAKYADCDVTFMKENLHILQLICDSKINEEIVPDYIKNDKAFRYRTRKEFIKLLAPRLMFDMIGYSKLFLGEREMSSLLVKNEPLGMICAGVFVTTLVEVSYGDIYDVENWKNMLKDNLMHEIHFKRRTRLWSVMSTLKDNFNAIMYTSMITATILIHILSVFSKK